MGHAIAQNGLLGGNMASPVSFKNGPDLRPLKPPTLWCKARSVVHPPNFIVVG